MSETSSTKKITIPSFSIPVPNTSAILVGLLVIASFLLGVLVTKQQYKNAGVNANNQVVQAAAQPQQPQQQAPQQPPSIEGKKVDVKVGHLPGKGNNNAKIQIVEFADFRCPFCEKFFTETEPQLIKDYVDTGKAQLFYRHFAFLGDPSVVAANASECANNQSKFWDMHDYLFKNQPSESDTSLYTTDSLTKIAGILGLNSTQFKSCLSSKKYDSKVSEDLTAGQTAGVNGTPTVFVNGVAIIGAQPYTVFKTAIDSALAK